MEDCDDYVFVVLKMPSYDKRENEIKAEQVSCGSHTGDFLLQ